MNKHLKAFIFTVIIILAFFVLAELSSRLVYSVFYKEKSIEESKKLKTEYYIPDSLLGWIRNSRFEYIEDSGLINSEGCWGPDFKITKDPNVLTILVLGDSITECQYPKSYPRLLEEKLNPGLGIRRWEVYNCGVADYGIIQEYLFLSKRLIKYKPDIVILGYFLNDARGVVPMRVLYLGNFIDKLFDKSRFIFFMNKIILKCAIKTQYKRWEKHRFDWKQIYKERGWVNNRELAHRVIQLAKKDWGLAWNKEGMERTIKYINKFSVLSKQYNFKFLLLIFPVEMQVYAEFEDGYMHEPQNIIGDFCKNNNIAFIDFLPYLKQHKSQNLFIDHCHYTQIGIQLIADKLFRIVEEL